MNVFICPVCHRRSVSYDARSRVLACHMVTCRRWFAPPADEGMLVGVTASDASEAEADRVQNWLNRQQPAGPPAAAS